ncbi:MAG: branched-chain amino acid ABC transporter permease [Kineosporiaceae bacterium]|nr:branched-chain amino acid ABC transporter permease [Kineosporiaceae bacterium]MBK7624982.1 branched-chain amino acid ABC transporter permease [Kineosporiaceae bacterium]MBK8076638.1 branched-chain amino acid ABC transporter permease [Kineosporiaceae bacterium]
MIRVLSYVLLAGAGVWVLYKGFTEPADFLTVVFRGLKFGALYALVALGYTMVYGIIELINFSHGDLFMLTTVMSGLIMVSWFSKVDPSVTAFLLMIGAMLVAMAAAAGVNTLAERVAYRRLRRAPKLAPLITAVGLSFIYQSVGIQMNGSGQRNWKTILGDRGFSLGGAKVEWSGIVVLAITIPLLLAMTFLVNKTRQGKAMRATAQDQDAARLMGVDVDRTIAFTFALGGALAGAAGMLWLESIGTTRYDLGFQLGLIAFTAAVLGGIGNLNGAVLGGFVIGFIQQLNEAFLLGNAWSQTVVFAILIMVMVFKPEGILGKPTTEKV